MALEQNSKSQILFCFWGVVLYTALFLWEAEHIQVPMWEDAHSYNAPSAGRLADAFQSSFQSKAEMVQF